jgi:hypothetical protein
MDSNRLLLSCPSARPDQEGAAIIGIVRRSDASASVDILPETVKVSLLIDLIPASVQPGEVLRFAAPCMESQCIHFSKSQCQLAKRIVGLLPEVDEPLRKCAIRPTCRWWHQEGRAACQRCPRIITEPYITTETMREVAQPPNMEIA